MKDKRFLVNLSKTVLLSVAIGALASIPLCMINTLTKHGADYMWPAYIPGFSLIAFARIRGGQNSFSSAIKSGAASYDAFIKKISWWQSEKNKLTKQR